MKVRYLVLGVLGAVSFVSGWQYAGLAQTPPPAADPRLCDIKLEGAETDAAGLLRRVHALSAQDQIFAQDNVALRQQLTEAQKQIEELKAKALAPTNAPAMPEKKE